MNFSMINKAKELKTMLDETQKELGKTMVEAEAGKGDVKVTVNGKQELIDIKIAPEAMDPSKPQNLEKLILKAINDANNKAQKIASKKMGKLTGGLNIPGLF